MEFKGSEGMEKSEYQLEINIFKKTFELELIFEPNQSLMREFRIDGKILEHDIRFTQ